MRINCIVRNCVLGSVFIGILSINSIYAEDLEPIAVVELFTSEGCSSCPPADAILRQITQDARDSAKKIYPLSFHVDYWNYLGWKDPFSQAQYTQRQHEYSKILHSTSVYTPQMIINGKNAFGGYRQDLATKGIQSALTQTASQHIELNIKKNTTNSISLIYAIKGSIDRKKLNCALVQRGLTSKIIKGENAGKILTHDNVVLDFHSIRLQDFSGEVIFNKPSFWQAEESSIIAYIQNEENGEITGASKIDF
ncbi:MAG: DUF1223 domain-containing protein [Candidatus Omnitrophica bacterium]|nr:DUF1223 domain-containing protein [Candidatus Omnitrophota bacterium]MCB9748358.1 DUF1223 domain-containing protein [Candidatus Omnitrophota bacterium]